MPRAHFIFRFLLAAIEKIQEKNISHNNKCSQKAKIYKSGEKRSVGKYNT